ncbi:MAG: hypothetical protein AABN95_07850 [Acidobacteriota bacterium]
MKKCPHCHEETFGSHQLFGLDYWGVDECPNCRQLVRNDGLRQFLVLPAILGLLAVGMLLFSIVPDVFQPFAFLIALILIALPVILLAKPVKVEQEVSLPAFSADPENDKVITVSGWNEVELRQILEGFIAENSSGWPPYKVDLHEEYKNRFRLSFPEDIHPSLFAFLVNYAMYPIEFETKQRRIIVAGRATLNEAFDGIPEEFLGQKAILYVPENDEEHDVVYLQTETGMNFANSLGENDWRQVDEARLPFELRGWQ